MVLRKNQKPNNSFPHLLFLAQAMMRLRLGQVLMLSETSRKEAIMTTQQIEYAKHLETQRHNQVSESQEAAKLAETVRYNTASLTETQRANLARESLTHETNAINAVHYQRSDTEARRHNMAYESIQAAQVGLGYAQLSEQQRHNVMGETIAAQQLYEQSRHNTETEAENVRSNKRNEEINSSNASARSLQAQSSFINAISNQSYTNKRLDEIDSNIRVNDARVRDLQNQSGNRTANTIINGVREGRNILEDIFNGKGGRTSEEKWLNRLDKELRRQGR